MRKPIIVANWKMYKTRAEAEAFCQALLPLLAETPAADAAICAPFTQLDVLAKHLAGSAVKIGAQNFYPEAEGAFTGEIAPAMLKELGVSYVLIGHSERRGIFGESMDLIKRKLECAYHEGFQPIFCVGETLEEREAGQSVEVCIEQLAHAVTNLTFEELSRLIIAYEPIWAIGTGKTATAEDAEKVIGALREYIAGAYGSIVAMNVRIQYGGSVRPDNIAELMAQEDIDGALVGGASLHPESFAKLVNSQENNG